VWRAKVTGNEGKSKCKIFSFTDANFLKVGIRKTELIWGYEQIPIFNFCQLPASQPACRHRQVFFARQVANKKEFSAKQRSHSSEYLFFNNTSEIIL
jgi:hypothetical protein